MKSGVHDLAVFGGRPAFSEKLHVGAPNIGDRPRFFARLNDILDRRWLTNRGRYVEEFERLVAEVVGVKHCVATCNGTLALEIAVRAAGLEGEVIIPAFTFIATAHALEWSGITPVFCDIDPETHTLDPARAELLISDRTSGIIGVHLWGRPCDIAGLQALAERRGLKLLFDAAQAFGCSYRGQMIGNFGRAEVFSFHATKLLNTFEGGAIVTNDDAMAEKARLMTNFGFTDYDQVEMLGTNGKMSEVAAAMGLTGLESIDEFIAANYRNYKQYQAALGGLPGVEMVAYDEGERCHYQYVLLEIDQARACISRDELVGILWAEGVLARRYFYPGCHRMAPYHSRQLDAATALPETERLARRVLALPTGTRIGPSEVRTICQIIQLAVANYEEIKDGLVAASTKHGST